MFYSSTGAAKRFLRSVLLGLVSCAVFTVHESFLTCCETLWGSVFHKLQSLLVALQHDGFMREKS
jgi:hypothetical protein